MGVADFNAACRTSVLRYTREWREYVTRQARWVDFDNDYKTLDLTYMESVLWAFKTLWDKGLIYQGFRALWYCWRCETPLSNTETRWTTSTATGRIPQPRRASAIGSGIFAGRRAGAGVDHHAVDAAVQPGYRGAPRTRRTSPCRREPALSDRRGPRTRLRPGAGRSAAGGGPVPGIGAVAFVTPRRSTSSPAGPTPTRCCPPIS